MLMGDTGRISSMDTYEFGKPIGQGTFGKVYIARNEITKNDCAIKVANLDTMTQREWELLMEEIYTLRELDHESIMKLETTLSYETCVYMVMPLIGYSSCSQILEEGYPTGMPENAVGMILSNVLRALEYLHERHYVHRGIKGSHILINANGAVILSGFRFTTRTPGKDKKIFLMSDLKEMGKNLNWLSPELLSQDKSGYSCNSDVYSVGITACELANGVVPYRDASASAMLVKKLEETPPRLWDKNFVPSQEAEASQPRTSTSHQESEEDIACATVGAHSMDSVYAKKSFSRDFHNFVSLCLVKEADLRPPSSQLNRQRFIRTYQNMPPSHLLRALNLRLPAEWEMSPVGDCHLPDEILSQRFSSLDIQWEFDY